MKKLVIGLMLVLVLTLTACGGSEAGDSETKENGTVVDNRTTTATTPGKVTDADFKIEEYKYENDYATTYYLVITNNSQTIAEVNANGIAKDASGNMLGAESAYIDVLGPGETSICYYYFSGVSGIEKVESTFSYNTDLYYKPVISNLKVDQAINDNNVTVAITNNGDYAAEFVEAIALFFDSNGNVIDTGSAYAIDADNEIKPGATQAASINVYGSGKSFSDVKVFLTGRAYTSNY